MAASQTEAREQVTLRRAVTPAMLLVFVALIALVNFRGIGESARMNVAFTFMLGAVNQAFARRTA